MQKIRVWTGLKAFPVADYEIQDHCEEGDVVMITFRSKEILGVVIEIIESSQFKLKEAKKTDFSFRKNYIKFIKHASKITLHNMQQNLSTNIKMFSSRTRDAEFNKGHYNKSLLNDEQKHAVDTVRQSNDAFLLWGVTGSGKTEVFFELVNDNLINNKQVLIILPEIAISESITDRFYKKFGFKPVIWNSKTKNKTNFNNIASGKVSVVIGSRCSIFLPFYNLGLIVVDEEHDQSYKQTSSPVYNCRDLAVILGKIENIPVVLASATPSLESFYNVERGNYKLITMTKRFNNKPLPKVNFVLNENNSLCNEVILKRTEEEVSQGKQVIFFLNKRGFGNFVQCKNCSQRSVCKVCKHPLTFHKFKQLLICHRCSTKYSSNSCLFCGKNALNAYGFGVEKVEQFLLEKFKDFKIAVISSDTCDSVDEIRNFIDKMQNKEIDIAIGTQILAKGHNFPEISLVVILGVGNTVLNFKSNEQIFQTLIQVAGRAGRGETSAEVLMQVDKDDSSGLLQFFKDHNYKDFLTSELAERKQWNLMPFVKIIAVMYIGKNERKSLEMMEKLQKKLSYSWILKVSDPIFIRYYRDQYYYKIFIRIIRENFIKYNEVLSSLIGNDFIVDVDPITLDI